MGCAAAVLIVPGTANAVPTGSADSGSAAATMVGLSWLPQLAEAAINCLIDGTPMQQCGTTGIDHDSMPVIGG
jgi:hypothetical protein